MEKQNFQLRQLRGKLKDWRVYAKGLDAIYNKLDVPYHHVPNLSDWQWRTFGEVYKKCTRHAQACPELAKLSFAQLKAEKVIYKEWEYETNFRDTHHPFPNIYPGFNLMCAQRGFNPGILAMYFLHVTLIFFNLKLPENYVII